LIPSLKRGDKVAIVATARKVGPEEMAPAISYLTSWGFQPVLSPALYEQCDQFAGNDETRSRALQEALDEPSVKAILFARGGYGTVRIIDNINWDGFRASPKWLAGFSDLTVLHSHVHSHLGIPTLHSPMAINMQPHNCDTESVEHLRRILTGNKPAYTIATESQNRPGVSRGIVTGGNLSVLYSILGSPSDIDTDGKILFIEDLDEYLYHIDRMMMNLKRCGKLAKLAGLIVGGMGDMKDNAIPFGSNAYESIARNVAGYNYPVCFGFPAGHDRKNLPLVLGAEATLEVREDLVRLSYND
jgi:muramoyltetrapeptide carboxypeptidase